MPMHARPGSGTRLSSPKDAKMAEADAGAARPCWMVLQRLYSCTYIHPQAAYRRLL